MGLFDTIASALKATSERAHLFSFDKVKTPGVYPRFTRDLRPLPAAGLTGGHLVELHAVLDERHPIPDANSKIRFDVLEEDFLLLGGLDDRIVSLLGTGASAPQAGAPTRATPTQILALPAGLDLAAFVEEYKRTVTDYEDTILCVTVAPGPGADGTLRTHLIGWHRLEHDDIGAHSEIYFVLDIEGRVRAASPVLEIQAAPPGASVRLRGSLEDANPLAAGTPEPLPGVPLTLEGRRAVTGPAGDFVVNARLAAGDHPLQITRPGIEPVTLTVRVALDGAGVATASVLDAAGAELVAGETADAATELSVVALDLPQPVRVVAHKLRGTVRWPESRAGEVPDGYLGSPLAERRVYVLPLGADGAIADARPKTTRDWEALKRRADVLRSCRPGRPGADERTDATGRFEVRYVNMTAGNRFLVWVERLDPSVPGPVTESPDLVVRAVRTPLVHMVEANLTINGNASHLDDPNRLVVNARYAGLAGPEVVPRGIEALRVADLGGTLSLVRPRQADRDGLGPPSDAGRRAFETEQPLAAGTGDALPVPAGRVVGTMAGAGAPVVGGFDLAVLPLVPVFEAPGLRGDAARRAAAALAAGADARFSGYGDIGGSVLPGKPLAPEAGGIRLVLDTSRLGRGQSIDLDADSGAQEPNDDAKRVKLLEATLLSRPSLANPETAVWRIDAPSLADRALIDPGPAPAAATNRSLTGTVHPVLESVHPLLPGVGTRRVYVGPGHGLFPQVVGPPPGGGAGAARREWDPANWVTDRGGWSANAGEDETDGLVARELARTLVASGSVLGTTLFTSRELFDLDQAGVDSRFAPVLDVVGPPPVRFPRLWQQGAYFYFGFAGDPAWQPFRNPANAQSATDFRDRGTNARIFGSIRRRAQAPGLDLIVFVHTNAAPAAEGGSGSLAEILNVQTAAGGEGNALGRAFANRLSARIAERMRTAPNVVRTMAEVRPMVTTGDLVNSYPHWSDGDAVASPRRDTAVIGWNAHPFPVKIPVALAEYAYHNTQREAELLGRDWYRRLAADATALGVHAQLLEATAAAQNADVQAVLRRIFGDTPPVRALAVAGVATPASIAQAVRDVADPAAPAPAGATLGHVVTAAMTAARGFTRQALVTMMRDALVGRAGWQATDPPALQDTWITGALTAGRPLDGPGEPPTRADAGALARAAVGDHAGDLRRAENVPVGPPATATPLLRPAAVTPDQTAFFSRIEANVLVTRLATLRPEDLYHVTGVRLVDAAWSRLDTPRGSGRYELDTGTPVTVVVDTAGIPLKTAGQDAANDGVADTEIRLAVAGRRVTLPCATRSPRTVSGATWILDAPPTPAPLSLTVELWIRRRGGAQAKVGGVDVTLSVRALPAP